MAPSGMLRRVDLIRTDVSEECNGSIIRNSSSVFRLLVTANVVPSFVILVTCMMVAIRSSDTSVLTRATRRYIPGDGILKNKNKLCGLFFAGELYRPLGLNSCGYRVLRGQPSKFSRPLILVFYTEPDIFPFK
jgi:hypothetical protein